MDQAFIRQVNQRIQEELSKKELEIHQYWLNELESMLQKRHQEMASLQLDLKKLTQKIQNRIKILKA